jgi:hypothetical protein
MFHYLLTFWHNFILKNAIVFASIDVLYYIYRFAYVEPPLHLWDNANLVMVYALPDVLLDSVCHYFFKDFSIDIYEGNWPAVLLLEVPLSGLGMKVILAL